jgi:prepilin peptidase CpaA
MEITQGIMIVVALIGVAACVYDIRTARIPNVLTFGAAAAGVVYHSATGGQGGLLGSTSGWIVGVLLFIPVFLLGGMGAGDVKLLAALGAWLGPWQSVWVALFSGIAGGALAVVVALQQGYLRTAARNIWLLLMHWRVAGLKPLPQLTLETSNAPRLPYAIPITVGLLVTLWRL